MSLDVYLTMEGVQLPQSDAIFIRENGGTREISRAEWDARCPGQEPVMLCDRESSDEVYSANITHNLNKMAEEAGIYHALWHPEKLVATKAAQLIEPLKSGVAKLAADPQHYKQFNPSNGWGDYEGLLLFATRYLEACQQYPEATIHVSS